MSLHLDAGHFRDCLIRHQAGTNLNDEDWERAVRNGLRTSLHETTIVKVIEQSEGGTKVVVIEGGHPQDQGKIGWLFSDSLRTDAAITPP